MPMPVTPDALGRSAGTASKRGPYTLGEPQAGLILPAVYLGEPHPFLGLRLLDERE